MDIGNNTRKCKIKDKSGINDDDRENQEEGNGRGVVVCNL